MNKYFKNFVTIFSVAMTMFMSSFNAMADDTEIFFSSVSLGGTTTVQPNVLLVLDTSSSMNSEVGTTGMNRLEHMKAALHTILDNTNNVNVGLMRFHGKGGPVLFPVADINADADTVLGTTTVPGTFNRIKLGTDDVEEASGVVDASSNELIIGNNTALLPCGDPGTTTISVQIGGDDDDIEEESDGDINNTSSDLDVGQDHVGLYFSGINIPPNAQIHCAELDFVVDDKRSSDTDVNIYIQDIGNAPTFNVSNNSELTSRFSGSEPSVAWDNIPNQNRDTTVTSPDFASLVQGVVDRVDWVSGNSMVFKISGSGHKDFKSNDHSGSDEPVLRISYTNVAAGSINQQVGLRFDDVKVPQGATITAAYIDFFSNSETHSDTSSVEIFAEDVDNSSAFSAGNTSDVTNRIVNKTINSPVSWSVPTWNPDTLYTTPDIKAIVQDVVDRTNWCGGNAMTFMLNSLSGVRKAISDDGDASLSPALRVEFDETTATGCTTQQIQAQISTGNDDAEEDTSGATIGAMDLGSTDLELNKDGSIEQLVGIRFQNINISSTDTIVSAELEFTVDEVSTGSTTVTIYGEYAGDAQQYNSNPSNISTRTKTTASVTWSPSDWDTVGAKHVTPDLTAIVQEIVGHSGWSALNSMAFIIDHSNANRRTAESHNGSPIDSPKLRINIVGSGSGSAAGAVTVRDKLHEVVDAIQYKSGTPIVDTLYEAGLYYRGDEVVFGRTRGGGYALSPLSEDIGSRSEYTTVSHEASYTGSAPTRDGACSADNLTHPDCTTERITGTATYDSPITLECQDNHIVLLSDGSPSRWNLDEASTHYFNKAACDVGTSKERCGREIVNFLHNNDQIDDSILSDAQKITSHTIGFNFAGSTFLQDLATEGGGGFYEASTAAQLATTFSEIFADVLNSPTSFVAPSVTINTFNRLSHRDELYFALFEPDDKPRWDGNIKRYRLDTSGTDPVIVDFQNDPAISATTGFFSSTSESWWSGFTDGNEIRLGGMAGELGTSRDIYTYTGTQSNLTNTSNAILDSNTALTDTMLDIVAEQAADPNYRSNLLSWINGVDVLDEDDDNDTSDAREYMGDPLHSRPVLVTYGGTITSPDITIFYGTNEGFIHAIDADDGSEEFAFMPSDLLPNLKKLYKNTGTPADHPYGMDGSVTPWIIDVDGDGQVESGDGDKVYIYSGMRRGGRSYYALDVTSRTSPQRLWTIQGGSGNFTELGQTWSQPVKTKVNIGGTVKDVLIFSGGYDENQDNAITPQVDNVGRALYIVDATDGSLLWWAGPSGSGADLEESQLVNSIPATPAVVDMDVDGLADHAYIGDMGGKVWRFDFDHGQSASSFGSATLLATLGDTDSDSSNDAQNNRRFYHSPTISLKQPTGTNTVYVSIGSGYQAHPLNQDIEDRFYVIKDQDVLGAVVLTAPIEESTMYDATANLIQDGTASQQTTAQNDLNNADGWFIQLKESGASPEFIGEKALSKPLVFNGVLFFTTYLPEDPSGGSVAASCQAVAGTGRTYGLNINDGSAVFNNWDGVASDLDVDDRYVKLDHVGIPPDVQILIPDGGLEGEPPVILVGTEILDGEMSTPGPELIYWKAK